MPRPRAFTRRGGLYGVASTYISRVSRACPGLRGPWRMMLTSSGGVERLGAPLLARWICGLSRRFYAHFVLSPS
jgi:hypothetical protein